MQNHEEFAFWTPADDAVVQVGPEQHPVSLPQVPLPVYPRSLEDGEPSVAAIGEGVYDYLRRFPDCDHNRAYAELLRDAFPHYIADVGSHAVMLDARDVSAAYLQRKINLLKILRLLDETNPGLAFLLGKTCFELLHEVSEFTNSRQHLLDAHGYLHQAQRGGINDLSLYNLLGEIDYLLGDFPAAQRNWTSALAKASDQPAGVRAQLKKRLEVVAHQEPSCLLDEMETVGNALLEAGRGDYASALEMLEPVAEQGRLLDYFQCVQLPYMIGICRERLGDEAGALVAFEEALALDPDYELAMVARERIISGDGDE
ncbi:MAG: hypothetical protein C0624_12440 [Desulfuromonas sp.]|nr:MAG: hypothetical protein C0624_12440 [Desulfuromonas sp.]